jgi:hypothetical protein
MYLGDAIGHTAGELVTNVEVNIKQHYVDFVTAARTGAAGHHRAT